MSWSVSGVDIEEDGIPFIKGTVLGLVTRPCANLSGQSVWSNYITEYGVIGWQFSWNASRHLNNNVMDTVVLFSSIFLVVSFGWLWLCTENV